MAQKCPLCRDSLPPELDGLYDLGYRALERMNGKVGRGEMSWTSLPASEREEMDDAVAVLTEAAAQGHMMAQAYLGNIYGFGFGVAQDDARAVHWFEAAVAQGLAGAMVALAQMLEQGRGTAADPQRAQALYKEAGF